MRKRRDFTVDYEQLNTEKIIENASLSNFRTLKVFIFCHSDLDKAYYYDIIIPKPHKAGEISMLIEREAEHASSSLRMEPPSSLADDAPIHFEDGEAS